MPAMKYLKKIITCVLTITLIIICGCHDNNTPSNPSKATTDAEYESAMHIAETTPSESRLSSVITMVPVTKNSCTACLKKAL